MTTMPRILSEISRMETALKSVDEEMNVLTAQLQSFDEKNVAGNNAYFFDNSSYRSIIHINIWWEMQALKT